MNGVMELVVVGAIIAAACAYLVIRVVKTLQGKGSSCCSDGDEKSKCSSKGCAGCSCGK